MKRILETRGELDQAVGVFDAEAEPTIFNQGKQEPLHEGQRRLWQSQRRFVAAFAGWRSGKTEIGPPWLLREIQRKGAGDYGVLGPTYPIINNKARPALRRYLISRLGPGCFHSSGDIWTLTEYGCKRIFGHVPEIETRILFRHGTNAEAIEAFDAKGIWVDEPGQMDDELHEAMEARVSIGRYRILYTSRPFKWNWYVTKIWNRVMDKFHRRKADAPEDIEVVNFSSLANPAFSPEEFAEQEAKLPPWKFDLKYRGIPTKPAGAIYSCFEEEEHTETRFPIPDSWQRAAGHDFGNKNMAGVWAAKHPEWVTEEGKPVWIVYSSYHAGDLTTQEHIQNFLYGTSEAHHREGWVEPPPEQWRVGKRRDQMDGSWTPQIPWAWGGNLTSETGWRGDFTSNGYPIAEPPEGAVDKGIETVFGMIKTGQIVFFSDMADVIDGLLHYTYEVDDEGEIILDDSGRPKIEGKSKWHLMDALRYLCVGLELGDQKIRTYSQRPRDTAEDEERELVRVILGEEEAKKIPQKNRASARVTTLSKPRVNKW